jgi:hypothetical protein
MARKQDFDPEEFDLNAEMETGVVIADVRGRLSVSMEGRHVETVGSMGEALKLAEDEMERRRYWPNVFYVNDHGNVDLIVLKPKRVKGKLVKVDYKIVHGWV